MTGLRRLHTMTGVIPLGLFLLLHSYFSAMVLAGPELYAHHQARIRSLPLLTAVELATIYAPLAVHATYGLWLTLKSWPPRREEPIDWGPTRQQATGVITLVFIAYHFFHTKLAVIRGVRVAEDQLPYLAGLLSSTTRLGIPLPAMLYLAGVSAASFHFSHGLFRAIRSWREPSTSARSRALVLCCAGLGVVLFLTTAATVIHLATGTPSWPA